MTQPAQPFDFDAIKAELEKPGPWHFARAEVAALVSELERLTAAIDAVRTLADSADPAAPCKHHEHLCPFEVMTELNAYGTPEGPQTPA